MKNKSNTEYIYGILYTPENQLVYIGSTSRKPSRRKAVIKYETFTQGIGTPLMQYILEKTKGDKAAYDKDFMFVTLFQGEFATKEERLYKERKYIDNFNPLCNVNSPVISYKERIEKTIQWQKDNKDRVPERRKKPEKGTYYYKNRDKVLERSKAYVASQKRRDLYKK